MGPLSFTVAPSSSIDFSAKKFEMHSQSLENVHETKLKNKQKKKKKENVHKDVYYDQNFYGFPKCLTPK